MRKLPLVFILIVAATIVSFSQKAILDGYVFEKYNRGFLNEVKVTILEKSGVLVGEVLSDANGHFAFELPVDKEFEIQYEKKIFVTAVKNVTSVGLKDGSKLFVKHEMVRQPGYLLEGTLAEKRAEESIPVDAVNGSRIEIFNLTTNKEELVIDSAKSPNFSLTLQQGNHYIILVRKKGFYNKRMEARVNVLGCYLCMEGFGTVNPGVVDNLTSAEDNKMGTLLANIELERIDVNKKIAVRNIYYASNSAAITDNAKKELDKVIILLQTNPSLVMELGSHTDSRGSDDANLKLSQARAQAAVDYITASGLVDAARLKAKGYGETRLVNKCGNGIICSDEDHIQNRRTELKIVGFTNDAYDGRSLMEIIHQEEMQKFLINGESNKVYIGNNAEKEAKKITSEEIKMEKPLPKPIKNKPTPAPPKQTVQTAPEATRADQFETDVAVKIQKVTPSVIEPKKAEMKENTEIKVNLTPINDYTGYKIEIFNATNPLTENDADLKMIASEILSDIQFDKLKNGKYAYLIGNFQNWSETEKFLDKITAKYPKARIVDYFKGKRVGN